MRKALVLMTLATAACGGGGGGDKDPDGGMPIDAPDAMPDATPPLEGMWKDTYHTATGDVTQSSCTTAPSAVKVDPANAAVTTYPGTCNGDGTFHIVAPTNLGTYYLKVGGVLYETTKRAGIDLSIDRLGRTDVAAITGVSLDLALTNLQAWTNGDLLVAFGQNIAYRQTLALATPPSAGQTTVTSSANWNGYKLDATKLDALQILQLGKHTTGGGYEYASLDRVYDAAAQTMMNNTPVDLSGALTTGVDSHLSLGVDVASFNQFGPYAGPTVASKAISGTEYATVSTDAVDSPPLISFAQASDVLSTMTFGLLAYTDPFPAGWDRMVKIQLGFTVPYSWNGQNGSLTATAVRVQTKASAESGAITALLGPPTDIKLDGADAMTANSITGVPTLSWSAPIVGSATDYEVLIYEVKSTGSLTFSPVLRMTTKGTSIRVPEGSLLGQRQYVFSVRARNRGTVDIYTTPLKNGDEYSSAEALTALVTTGS